MPVTLKLMSACTEINIEQSGLTDVIPVEAFYLCRQASLRKPGRLVEPDIQE